MLCYHSKMSWVFIYFILLVMCLRSHFASTAPFSPLLFYCAMLCIRSTSHGPVSVCLSVRPSQVGVLLKQLNVYDHTNNTTR